MTKTVLLIDYDPRSISRLRSLLNAAGYHTVVAHDGAQGREEFERISPHLTLIQDLLPKGHGFQVCRELKETEHGRMRPIVLLTAPRSGGRRHELLATKCDDFVEKPFDDETLLRTVRQIIPPEPCSIKKTKAQKDIDDSQSVAAAAIVTPGIPVEFTEGDLGSRLDDMFLGPVAADSPAEEKKVETAPKNGTAKRRSLRSLFGLSAREV